MHEHYRHDDDPPDRPNLLTTGRTLFAALLSLFAAIWFTVTWADDKLQKIERVPPLEEAVLQLKMNQELLTQRQNSLSEEMNRNNAAILYRLDRLIEEREHRDTRHDRGPPPDD